ncbi:MAG: hypothetical protein J6A95_04465 [Clostridia bacterium]|nr:hypothetical protein [Clostridia bacterium]
MDKKTSAIKIFKIAGAIIYALTTIFLIIMLSAVMVDMRADKDLWELGGALSMVITLIASIAYIIPIILGGIGTVMSGKIGDKKSKLYFIFMIFVPVVTAAANFVTYLIILK